MGAISNIFYVNITALMYVGLIVRTKFLSWFALLKQTKKKGEVLQTPSLHSKLAGSPVSKVNLARVLGAVTVTTRWTQL